MDCQETWCEPESIEVVASDAFGEELAMMIVLFIAHATVRTVSDLFVFSLNDLADVAEKVFVFQLVGGVDIGVSGR